ncbi:MAG: alpha-mannosidase [Acidimicrobiales bacterium]|nr:alpha-mannosidase [Acidimicrobiales bacterium]
MPRQVHVVPHTHWDREWYKPYPVFRMQLVELLDTLLPTLSEDTGYAHFQLDGQMAVVDDYLEIRPQERDRLVALAAEGKLSMGPWYTLPDEFLVSGETLVRNLQLGLRRATEFGGAMDIGYLPDMFGHVAQMPQLLRQFGFADAVVWRGIPSAVVSPAFTWEGPDGSQVRAEYLSDGYSNGARLPDHGKDLVEQVEAFRRAQGPLVGDPILWMNGTDHQLPQAWLGRVVAEANEAQDDYRFTVTSLASHLAAAPRDGLPTWVGELRSGARTNLLMGVASCRVDVKQAAATAERWLERVAEPLAACWLPADAWPGAFLDVAWRDVIRNAAHDSICGCSADDVNQAVLHRYCESTLVARALADRALVRAVAATDQPTVAVNPTSRDRAFTATAVVEGEVAPPHTQQLSYRPAVTRAASLPADAAVAVVIRAAMEDPRASAASLALAPDGSGEWIATVVTDRAPKHIDPMALRAQLEAIVAADPATTVHLDLVRPAATQQVLLRSEPVPGFGWRGLAPADLGAFSVRTDGQGLTNGLVTVVADQSSGTFSLNGVPGYGRLVDEGDAGDTYNWNPPEGDLPIERPVDVDVLVSEAGPVRGRIEIVRSYRWPTQIAGGRRRGEALVSVTTVVELHAGEDLVRVSVSFDNVCEDHRLRIHLPLPEPADHSVAECAYGTVRRGLTAEGGPTETGLPTFPSRRFVAAGGLLVAHEGLSEYELVELEGDGSDARAHELALTLIRCTGLISQVPMAMRAVPAGPHTPVPANQMPGHHGVSLVLHVGGRDPYAVVDEAYTPVLTARFPGRTAFGDPATSGQHLQVSGAEVTALRRTDDGRLELRVVNPTDEPATLAVDGRTGQVVDLRGQPTGEAFEGTLELGPWKIATLVLEE